MSRRSIPLAALRSFEAAARLGSFKLASAELAVTPTAISHQIRSLEEQTGLVLFDRQVRRVVLTSAGSELFPVLRDGFDAIEAVLNRLAKPDARSRVTISATGAFITKWLVPRITDFRDGHPDVDLHMQASEEPMDLRTRAIDIAIRYGRGPYPGLSAEPLFTDRFAPVANPHLGLSSISDVRNVPLVQFDWKRAHPDNPTWERWFAAEGLAWPPAAGVLLFSDESHAIQAAVAGHGVALLSLALVSDELQQGHLAQPFGKSLPGHTYHLVTHAGREPAACVNTVASWLRAQAVNAAAMSEDGCDVATAS